MVVRHALTTMETDRIFRALADATRRDIVIRLLAGEPASVSALTSHYDTSCAAVQKHVAVLEEAGLVTKHPHGRERLVRGNPKRLSQARALLAQFEQLWFSRIRQLDALLTEPRPPRVESDADHRSGLQLAGSHAKGRGRVSRPSRTTLGRVCRSATA